MKRERSFLQRAQSHRFMIHGTIASMLSRVTQLEVDPTIPRKLKTDLHYICYYLEKVLKQIKEGGLKHE